MIAERSIQSAATDHQETLPYEASPIAKSLTKEAIVEVDSQSPDQPDLCRSLSGDFKKATESTTPGNPLKAWYYAASLMFFPTCQVRVVRFYHSCSGCSSSFSSTSSASSSFSSTTSASTSTSTSALPTLRQSLRQLPRAVGTAGPQLPASDLSGTAGPQPQGSERSGHRWTSTRDLPSLVGTAGPGTFRAQWAPLDLSGQMECQNICQKDCQNICQIDCQNICHIECHIECQNICEKECHIECQIECQNIYQIKCWKICQIEYQNRCQIEW